MRKEIIVVAGLAVSIGLTACQNDSVDVMAQLEETSQVIEESSIEETSIIEETSTIEESTTIEETSTIEESTVMEPEVQPQPQPETPQPQPQPEVQHQPETPQPTDNSDDYSINPATGQPWQAGDITESGLIYGGDFTDVMSGTNW